MRGTSGAVLVASSPDRPVQAVGPVSLARWDDCAAQQPQQLRDGERDQFGAQLRASVLLAVQGGGHGQVDVGEQADRGLAVPGRPADDLSGVQADGLLGQLMIFLPSQSAWRGTGERARFSCRSPWYTPYSRRRSPNGYALVPMCRCHTALGSVSN